MITKNASRQSPIYAMVEINASDIDAFDGTFNAAIECPQNTIIVGGFVDVVIPFNSSTSDIMQVGDDIAPNRYASSVDLHTDGIQELTPTGFVIETHADIGVSITSDGGPPTQRKPVLYLEYVVSSRAQFTQG
jgi:hypothetical protein